MVPYCAPEVDVDVKGGTERRVADGATEMETESETEMVVDTHVSGLGEEEGGKQQVKQEARGV